MATGIRREVSKGQVFGRLTVIKEVRSKEYKSKHKDGIKTRTMRRVKCKCECGNTKVTKLQYLFNGHTTSCGCYAKEVTATRQAKKAEASKRHHPLRMTYHNMNERCYNPNAEHYADYGGRGIKVCNKWRKRKGSQKEFLAFVKWAESNGWLEDGNLQINRIDNDGNYKPSNCEWVTRSKQARNKSNSRKIEIKGSLWQVDDALEKFGVEGLKKVTLLKRLNTGWKPWDALTTPVAENMSVQARNRVDSRFIVYKGIRLQIDDAREKYGHKTLTRSALEHRLRAGWSVEKALKTPILDQRTKPNSVILKIGKKEYQIDDAIEHFHSDICKGTILKRMKLGWPHKKALMQPIRFTTNKAKQTNANAHH